jgi:hypothetical protein
MMFISVRQLLLCSIFLFSMKVSFDYVLMQTLSSRSLHSALLEATAENATLSSLLHVADAVVEGMVNTVEHRTRTVLEDQYTQMETPSTTGSVITPPKSDYAYATVIGGCDLRRPAYRGFLYNLLVATQILREEGSTADVVAYFQIGFRSPGETLPSEDERLLQSLGVRIRYIPKSMHESFYETVMNKFRVLALTEYKRVILMDGDIMPLANLDYLFRLSMDGTLKENVIVAGLQEPANAGFFLVTPGEGEYERVVQIIHEREQKAARNVIGRKFDPVSGWGHEIVAPDYWRSRTEKGRLWDFHFAFSDQGLLFHYTKYVKNSVSIVYVKHVENWGLRAGTMVLQKKLELPLHELRTLRYNEPLSCLKFMCDFIHFSGMKKPWVKTPVKDYSLSPAERLSSDAAKHMWWHTLYKLDQKLNIGLDFDNWKTNMRPSLGFFATYEDLNRRTKMQGGLSLTEVTIADPTLSKQVTSPVVPDTDAFVPSKFAYAFVIGGCNPDNNRYKGFVYNVMVSTRILREEGAQADVIAFFQMSYNSTSTELPKEDSRVLQALGVKIEYIPKSELEGFYDTVMNKFRILQLSQYRRVMLMDADVIPISNPDFYFRLSDGPSAILKENVLVMGNKEPANAGWFMLAPAPGEWEKVQEIMKFREELVKDTDLWPRFDVIKGWGHEISPDDPWETRKGEKGTKWDFHFAYSDQGLLYHYVKYVRKSFSLLHGFGGNEVQNWGQIDANGPAVLQERLKDAFILHSKPRLRLHRQCNRFLCDFSHATGLTKPWMSPPHKDRESHQGRTDGAHHLWWHALFELDKEFNMGIDFESWNLVYPPLGMFAKSTEVRRRIESLHGSNKESTVEITNKR